MRIASSPIAECLYLSAPETLHWETREPAHERKCEAICASKDGKPDTEPSEPRVHKGPEVLQKQ